jgi:hypothetical protein
VHEHPAPAEPALTPRRAARRFWFSTRSNESAPEAAEKDSDAPVAEDHRRMFRFF